MEARQCMGAILTAAVLLQTTSLVRPCVPLRSSSVSVGYAPTTLIISRERKRCTQKSTQSELLPPLSQKPAPAREITAF